MKQLVKGNHAVAEAAVRAGCRFFAGYPITPQSEIPEYMSWRMDEVGGAFVQTESEIAGISMVYGAAATGVRAFTSSSGPGFSLMQEGISYMAAAELPCLIADVQRYGAGLADIFTGQGDYWQAVKNGGHSDYRCIVLAPSDVQEAVDLVRLGFALGEKHRNPVVLLSDASLGQMMESVEYPDFYEHDPDSLPWAMKGKGKGQNKRHTSVMYYHPKDYDDYWRKKYRRIEREEQRFEGYRIDDAAFVLVSYGISARICREAVDTARAQGVPLGMLRPVTLYPFPTAVFDTFDYTRVKGFASVELSCFGQMVEDVRLAVAGRAPVGSILGGQFVYTSSQVLSQALALMKGGQNA